MPNRLTRITTRGGDKGESGLADGSRHSKFAPQFAALGDIDELNCVIGIVVTLLDAEHPLRVTLIELQSRLFDLGGAIAMPGTPLSLAEETAALEQSGNAVHETAGPARELHPARRHAQRARRCTSRGPFAGVRNAACGNC